MASGGSSDSDSDDEDEDEEAAGGRRRRGNPLMRCDGEILLQDFLSSFFVSWATSTTYNEH